MDLLSHLRIRSVREDATEGAIDNSLSVLEQAQYDLVLTVHVRVEVDFSEHDAILDFFLVVFRTGMSRRADEGRGIYKGRVVDEDDLGRTPVDRVEVASRVGFDCSCFATGVDERCAIK